MIDKFLIEEVFEKFAHFFQKWTGYDNFFLARVTISLSLITLIGGKVLFGNWTLFTPVIIVTQVITLLWYIPLVERRSKNDLARGYKNFLAGREQGTRLIFCFGCILNLLLLKLTPSWHFGSFVVSSGLFTCTLYLTACTPLLPTKGKLKEMLESFASSLRPEPLPT